MATGWLRWSPRDAWDALVPEILLACEGAFEFAVKTNPLAAPKKEGQDKKAIARETKTALRVAVATRKSAQAA